MRFGFTVRITADDKELDADLVRLLEAVRAHGSLAAAARAMGCSYRFAWDRLRAAERDCGQPLVALERGRGARLAALGERLLAALERARTEATPVLDRIAQALPAHEPRRGMSQRSLRICASHDLALIELKHYCALAQPPLALALRFRGSMDALEDLARGGCDLAGFHVCASAQTETTVRKWLNVRQHQLIVLADRRQGFMLAAGNPKNIRSLGDLARREVRFVNRQPGSGTRLLLDRLLAASACSPADIPGYDVEEFTHVAVAATIASGHADAGFGIEAAAAQYGLAFLPIATETYYLAARRALFKRDSVRALITCMTTPALHRRLARLRGYDVSACGAMVDVDRAWQTPAAAAARARAASPSQGPRANG
ncbi:MAG: helix-turn-helix transcriptional regulator [Burkholderiales bacterium]|nr:helix-turn-helix transcriptional regulator [Burkholderiales bacterium]